MRKCIHLIVIFGLPFLLIACGSGGGSAMVGIYHHHHGFGPWWGSRTYFRDRIIIVPPDGGEGPQPELPIEPPGPPVPEQPIEPTVPMPLPSMDSMDMGSMDMGMPDIDFGSLLD